MKAAVVIFPGSNRDQDMIDALTLSMGGPPITIWHRDTEIPDVDLIVLPGGFSYGDYLRSGAMAARSPVMRTVVERAGKGIAILGVCNGFQILTEAGLLPGALMRNAGLKFVCRDTHLRVESSQTVFTGRYRAGQVIRVPVAHHDGNFFADEALLDQLEERGQIAFRYCDDGGQMSDSANPNGSARHIAGIFNESRTVLGLMPHPENLVADWQGGSDGRPLFDALVEALS